MKEPLKFHNRTVVGFYARIELQTRLLTAVQGMLPEDLAKHIQHCLIKNNCMLIYTESAVWGSQLRFYERLIISRVSELLDFAVVKVQIRILAVPTGLAIMPGRKAQCPSMENIDRIRADSLAITDGQLQSALLKLTATLGNLAIKQHV
jgi:hypothetical protein